MTPHTRSVRVAPDAARPGTPCPVPARTFREAPRPIPNALRALAHGACVAVVAACGAAPPVPTVAVSAAAPVVVSAAAPDVSVPRPVDAPPKNGFFAVLGAGPDPASAAAAAGARPHRIVAYDDPLSEEQPPPPREWLAISPEVQVPFVLASAPELGQSDKGFASLLIVLSPESTRALEAFTREQMDQRAAIAIGGRIVSTHRIKAVISAGRVQISRCTDNACEVLRSQLLAPAEPPPPAE